MRPGRTLYRREAAIKLNNRPQSELEYLLRLWRNQPLSRIPPGYYLQTGQQLPELSCDRDVPYTVVKLTSSPTTSRNPNWNTCNGCGGISHRVKFRQGTSYVPPQDKSAKSWVLMRQRRTLYRREADVEPNNLPQSELKYLQWLWRNLLSSKVSPALPKTTSIEDSDFMSFDVTGTYLIPACSRRRAQQPPANRIGIPLTVVE